MSKAEPSVVDVFAALGDGTRLSVVKRLGTGAALSATALTEGSKVTRQAIAKHLQVLEAAGLVSSEKRGREVLYALEPRRLAEATDFLDHISQSWDSALERLAKMVETPEPSKKRSPDQR